MNKLPKLKQQLEVLQEKIKLEEAKQEAEKNKVDIDTENLFKFKKLEITRIANWNKPYNQIVCPKGFRLIKVQELWDLLDSDKRDEFLGDYKGKYNWFWCEQTRYAKENNRASGLDLDGDLSLGSGGGNLADSDDGGRVVFVKIKESK